MDADISRAKRIDTGEWVLGFYVRLVIQGVRHHFIVLEGSSEVSANTLVEIDDNTRGRCTGEPDKNGVIVFEGDILSPKTLNEFPISERMFRKEIPAHIVTWRMSMYEGCPTFKAVSSDGKYYHDYMRALQEREVIGNVHDNECI